MNAPQVLATLRARGIELAAAGDRLRIRPAGVLTREERATLIAHKAEVLALVRAERPSNGTTHDDSWADDVPSGPCGLCGAPLAWVEDWPTVGEARWLCLRCAAQPAPSLVEVFASLTAEERVQLVSESIGGDTLAAAVLSAVNPPARAARHDHPDTEGACTRS